VEGGPEFLWKIPQYSSFAFLGKMRKDGKAFSSPYLHEKPPHRLLPGPTHIFRRPERKEQSSAKKSVVMERIVFFHPASTETQIALASILRGWFPGS
jgi:hypothetical protein